ncbi:MAG: hypothetical protein ACXWVK_10430 [Rhodoplanes sp.]
MIDEVLDAGAAALGLIIDDDAARVLAELLEPGRVDREWKACARPDQADVLRDCNVGALNGSSAKSARAAASIGARAKLIIGGIP